MRSYILYIGDERKLVEGADLKSYLTTREKIIIGGVFRGKGISKKIKVTITSR